MTTRRSKRILASQTGNENVLGIQDKASALKKKKSKRKSGNSKIDKENNPRRQNIPVVAPGSKAKGQKSARTTTKKEKNNVKKNEKKAEKQPPKSRKSTVKPVTAAGKRNTSNADLSKNSSNKKASKKSTKDSSESSRRRSSRRISNKPLQVDLDEEEIEEDESEPEQPLKKSRKSSIGEYEQERLRRIRENQQELANLGINANLSLKPNAEKVREAKRAAARKRKPLGFRKPKTKRSRVSRRLQGKPAEHNIRGARLVEKEGGVSGSDSEEEDEIQDDDTQLLEKWKAHVQEKQADDEFDDTQRRLFLVPTGVEGVNDHTLYEKVKQVDSYLWGFCQGLYSRIFLRVRPGDIFLFVSSGVPGFNRISRVRETKVVPKSVADQFWSRMSFSMGGCSKSNVGFPLLTPIDKPKDIDWNKKEVLKLLGYTDHLQSSRWIKPELISTPGGQCVFHRCLTELGLGPNLTTEEIEKAKNNEESSD